MKWTCAPISGSPHACSRRNKPPSIRHSRLFALRLAHRRTAFFRADDCGGAGPANYRPSSKQRKRWPARAPRSAGSSARSILAQAILSNRGKGRFTRARILCSLWLNTGIPFISTIFPEATLSATYLRQILRHLDSHNVLGMLITELALDAEA